jgi:hypothetical protein
MYQVPQFSAKHIKTDVSLQPFASLLPQLGLLHPARCRRISVLDIFLTCSCEGLFYYAVSDGRTRPLKIHRGNYTPHSIYCDRINLCQKIRQATTNSPCGHSLEATIANYHLRNFCKITYSFSHYLIMILSFQFVVLCPESAAHDYWRYFSVKVWNPRDHKLVYRNILIRSVKTDKRFPTQRESVLQTYRTDLSPHTKKSRRYRRNGPYT